MIVTISSAKTKAKARSGKTSAPDHDARAAVSLACRKCHGGLKPAQTRQESVKTDWTAQVLRAAPEPTVAMENDANMPTGKSATGLPTRSAPDRQHPVNSAHCGPDRSAIP